MPEISRFLGIIIAMYYNDHNPPHFHARYGNFHAVIAIDTGEIIEGGCLHVSWALFKSGVNITKQNLQKIRNLPERERP